MSLDVYLIRNVENRVAELEQRKQKAISQVGSMVGLIPVIKQHYESKKPKEDENVFEYNITHNLSKMAAEAGIYNALWHPEDIQAVYAKDLINTLTGGLISLKADPNRYIKFNATNGWGKYENLVEFVEQYLQACIDYPDAKIEVSR